MSASELPAFDRPGAAASRAGEPAEPEAGEDSCPLCGAALAPEQDWCLQCGAAARTRLATTPRWRPPLVALLVLAGLCLAVLAGALVKLARGSGPAPAPIVRFVTTTPASAPAAGATGTSGTH